MPMGTWGAGRWIGRPAVLAVAAIAAATGAATTARSETTLIVEYDPDPCQHVAALAQGSGSAGALEAGPVTLDVKTFAYVTCEKVREDVVASINAQVDKVRTTVEETAQAGVNYIYDGFWFWLSAEVYDRLPAADKAQMKPEEHFQEWLKSPDQELVYYVNWYFRQKAPAIYDLLERYRNDTSGEIVDGLSKLWSSAREKLEKLDQAYQDMEANPNTPYADILRDNGLSGALIDRLEEYEGRFDLFDQEWGIVEASRTMYGAFTADSYPGQLEGMFSMFEQLGGLLEDSRVPGISLVGTLVKSYGEMAKEILKRANELEAAIRKREGYCIGADTHTLLNDRAQALMGAYGDGIQACPLHDSKAPEKDIYVQTEPDDASQLYFWHSAGFIKGIEGGGGVDGLDRAKAFIANAAAGFPPYQDKEADLPTLASVYNTPYRPELALEGLPGHVPGRGLPGLLQESDLLFDTIVTRVNALQAAFAPDATCGEDAFNAWIESESGLRVEHFPLDDPETLGKLKTSYALGFIQGHELVPGAAVIRTQAYATFRRIWPRLRDLSLVEVSGDVRQVDAKSEPCAACAGAALAIAVENGQPLCPASTADESARFRQRVGTRSPDVSLRLTASLQGKTGETAVVDQRHLGLAGAVAPFTATFDLSLFVPLEREALDPGAALVRMRGILGKAEAAQEVAAAACARLQAALAALDESLPAIESMSAELTAEEAALAADSGRIRQIHGQARALSEQADEAALKVVEAKDIVEDKAEAACNAAEALQATDEEEQDARARLLETARAEATAARNAAEAAANEARRARQSAQSIADAVRRGEDLSERLGRIREMRRTLAQQRSRASEALQTVAEVSATLETNAAELATWLKEAQLVAQQAASGSQQSVDATTEVQGLVSVIEGYAAEAEACRERSASRSEEAQAAWERIEEAGEAEDANGAGDEAELRLMVADLQAFESLASAGADVADIYAAAAGDGAAQAETCASLGEGIAEGGDAATAAAVSAAIAQCDFSNAELGLSQMAPGDELNRLRGLYAEAQEREAAASAQIDEGKTLAQSDDLAGARAALERARASAVCDETRARIDDLLANLERGPAVATDGDGDAGAGGGFATDAAFWAGPWAGEVRLSTVEVDGARMDGAGLLTLIDNEVARLKAKEAREAEDDATLGAAVADAIASGIAEAVVAMIKVGLAVLDQGVPMTFTLEPEADGYRLMVPGESALAQQVGSSLKQLPLFQPLPSGDLQLVYPLPDGGGGLTALLLRPQSDEGDLTVRIELRGVDQAPPEERALSIRELSVVVEGVNRRALMTVEEAAAILTPQIEAAVARYAPELRE